MEKLNAITDLKLFENESISTKFSKVIPDEFNDWINQRDNLFNEFISIGSKKNTESVSVFNMYSSGVKTNRDAWCYNFSKKKLKLNINLISIKLHLILLILLDYMLVKGI